MKRRKLTSAERIQKRAAEMVLRGWCRGTMAKDRWVDVLHKREW